MRYLSVCSGIEAATVAWQHLGWTPVAFSEIEPFPCAVLAERYPHVPNLGDMTRYAEWPTFAIDVLVGGTPCQSFSVAGLRAGLADPRGNLALVFLGLVDKYRPRWVIWENVPGVRSSWSGPTPPSDLEQGREWESEETSDFGCFLDGLAKLGYCCAYRSLDAQYLGVAQRRERVFVVAHLGDWRPPAAVLLERHGLLGHPAPRRTPGEGVTGGTSRRPDSGHVVNALTANNGQRNEVSDVVNGSVIPWPCEVTPTLNAHFGDKQGLEDQHALNGAGMFVPHAAFAIQERAISENPNAGPDGIGVRDDDKSYTLEARSVPQAVAFDTQQITSRANRTRVDASLPTSTLAKRSSMHVATQAVALRGREGGATAELSDVPSALRASTGGGDKAHVLTDMQVRRLTPRECERLQGFPDDYTLVTVRNKPAKDGPRYKALGNSMAVPVMHWIGSRIEQVEALLLDIRAAEFPALWLRMLS